MQGSGGQARREEKGGEGRDLGKEAEAIQGRQTEGPDAVAAGTLRGRVATPSPLTKGYRRGGQGSRTGNSYDPGSVVNTLACK